jgi:hypothetical protein
MTVVELLRQLESDLRRNDLSHVERVPAPRAGERYRDVVFRFFMEYGVATVYIRVLAPSLDRRYVITAKYDWAAGGVIEGWVIEGDAVKVYEPIALSVEDIGRSLDYYGNVFWSAEERILARKMSEAYEER